MTGGEMAHRAIILLKKLIQSSFQKKKSQALKVEWLTLFDPQIMMSRILNASISTNESVRTAC